MDPECPESVTTFLEAQIDRLIREAQRERLDADGKKPILPIVRLRVDYTGFSTINSQVLCMNVGPVWGNLVDINFQISNPFFLYKEHRIIMLKWGCFLCVNVSAWFRTDYLSLLSRDWDRSM